MCRHQKTKEVETLDRELQAYKKAVKQLESENKNKVSRHSAHIRSTLSLGG